MEDDLFTLDDQGTDSLVSSSSQIELLESNQQDENLVEVKGDIIDFDDLEADVSNDNRKDTGIGNQCNGPHYEGKKGLKSDFLSLESEIYNMDFGGNFVRFKFS